jgi:hypothetical protein
VPGGRLARDRAGGLEAVEVRHHHVHQDQVGKLALRGFDAGGAVLCGDRGVAELLDDAGDAGDLRRRIVDDENACHGVPRAFFGL